MRDIRFRGKRIDNGEWVYGWYLQFDHQDYLGKSYIMPLHASAFYSYEVIPETVGQYTGEKNVHGTEIYEDDIMLWEKNGIKIYSKINFSNGAFWSGDSPLYHSSEEVVAGNIHDNPELLKQL